MRIDLIFNILIICMLFPTIIYAVILNQKLKNLRSNQEDFGKLIWAFNDATNRAEAGTTKLKQLAESSGTRLKDQVDKASVLKDDLTFLIEKSNSSADRLENAVKQARNELKNVNIGRAERAERVERPVELPKGIMPDFMPKKAPQRLKPNRNSYADDGEFIIDEDERSEAERELIKALQAIR